MNPQLMNFLTAEDREEGGKLSHVTMLWVLLYIALLCFELCLLRFALLNGNKNGNETETEAETQRKRNGNNTKTETRRKRNPN